MAQDDYLKSMREQFGFYDRPRRFSREELEKRAFDGEFLSNIDCSHMDLRGIDLSGCIFEQANFSGADLGGANLKESIFTQSDFDHVGLQKAQMKLTVFSGV